MRISPVSYTPYRRNNINLKQNLSFEKNMRELFYPFGYDLIQYYVNSDKVSVEGLKQVVQKYSPETKVDSMANYNQADERKPNALFDIQLDTYTDEKYNETSVMPVSKTVYLRFDDCSDDKAGIFLAEVLHEATHIFQQEADDRMSYKELCEIYLNNSPDKISAKNTLKVMDKIFISLESSLSEAYEICLKNNSKRLKERDREFQQEFSLTVEEFIIVLTKHIISKNVKDKIDYNFLYDYLILRARNEEEAYRNMINFRPKLIDKNSYVGRHIEMYDKMASVLSELREKYNG